MKKLSALFLSIVLFFSLAVPVVTMAWANKQDEPVKAPLFPKNGIWLGEELQPKKIYKGNLTLVYFWDYASINSIRDVQVVRDWVALYKPYGLNVVWVHSPEFKFAFEPENVKAAVKRMQIEGSVFLDNEFILWEGFQNRSWPTKHLVDQNGHVVFTHVGEGNYVETEFEIQNQLQKLNPNAALPNPLIQDEYDRFNIEECGFMSTETYFGYKRASWWGGEVANRRWMSPDETMMFTDRGDRVERGFFLQGLWGNYEDELAHERATETLEDYVGLVYVGNEVYAIASKALETEEPLPVYVTRDDDPVPADMRGSDIKIDDEGRTYFDLTDARLYYLIENEDQEAHELRLWPTEKGVAIHSVSFANSCLSEFEKI